MQLLCFYTRYSYIKTVGCTQPLARVFMMRATMSLGVLVFTRHSLLRRSQDVPVETKDFSENENEDHADEDPRLAHERTHALC
jgi:hypothetical protein